MVLAGTQGDRNHAKKDRLFELAEQLRLPVVFYTEGGGGRIVVVMSDADIPVDVSQEAGRVVVNFEDTELPSELMKRLDVMDFATPVSTVDVLKVNDDTRLVIAARGKFEELASLLYVATVYFTPSAHF